VLCFTAEEAWLARFGEGADSIHMGEFPLIPPEWRNEALAAKWDDVRDVRGFALTELESLRRAGEIGSSLQAKVRLNFVSGDRHSRLTLTEADWAETIIASQVEVVTHRGNPNDPPGIRTVDVTPAAGDKCDRCWRVLPEVGASHAHPTLCRRCEAVVEGAP
jgi:isoleucyl-tRNA synthetase